jgi:hypothetical protein
MFTTLGERGINIRMIATEITVSVLIEEIIPSWRCALHTALRIRCRGCGLSQTVTPANAGVSGAADACYHREIAAFAGMTTIIATGMDS